ncbi:MAG: response regulator [Cyanobacteria bacterium P01_A01_bin.3]
MSSLIAIVDDDSTLRTIVKGILEARGYQVFEADSAAACLNLCNTICPDLILLDALMPEMDGFECCRKLRSRFTKDELPIVMVTGLEDASTASKVMTAGANEYVAKPIQWPKLFAAIGGVLAAT